MITYQLMNLYWYVTLNVQELCVSILPSFASMMDYSSMKHSIIPRITALCISARETSVSTTL